MNLSSLQVARERAFQDKRDHWIDPDVTKFLRRKGSSLPRHRPSRVFRQNRCAIDEPRQRTFFHNSPFVSGLADMLTFCQGIDIRGDTARKHFTHLRLSLWGAGNCSSRQTKEVKVLYRRYKVGSSSFCGKSRQTHLFLWRRAAPTCTPEHVTSHAHRKVHTRSSNSFVKQILSWAMNRCFTVC